MKLKEIAKVIGATLEGPGDEEVESLKTLEEASEKDLSFLTNPRYIKKAKKSQAKAIIVDENTRISQKILLHHPNPYYAFARAMQLFYPEKKPSGGISPDARVDPSARVDPTATIYPWVYVDREVTIGPRCILYPGVVVMEGCILEEEVVLFPRVVLYPRCHLGKRVRIHAGACIGSDGFGYAFHEGIHHKIPQVGGVVIEADVEIGANTTIDGGTLSPTRIGEGCKLDNLVQVGHNVDLGAYSLLVSLSGISGSTRTGKYCIFAGQSGAVGHITLGDHVTISAKSSVTRNTPSGSHISGHPGRPHHEWLRELAVLRRLAHARRS